MTWDGDEYQARFDALAARGTDVHGEARFVLSLRPRSVLDAGCGTGRVAIEIARHGVEVVGVDLDASMLAAARSRAPDLEWVEADLGALDLGCTFDVVVMAGNVPLFTPPGTRAALVAGCARHLAPGGGLVTGFQLGGGYDLETFDADASASGLALDGRWSSWDRDLFGPDDHYAVSLHRVPSARPPR